jgi:putative ABC transport system permease protein
MMKALGAGSLDIAMMVITETVIITAAGGLVGVAASVLGSGPIEQFVKGLLPYSPTGTMISYSPELIVSAIAFSGLLGILCGIYPAIKSSRLTPMEAIRSGIE